MGKRTMAALFASALIAGSLSVGTAQAAPEVPAVVNIEDPDGDANYGTGVSGWTGADVLKAWFADDAENLYVYIQTKSNARLDSFAFDVSVDPGVGTACMFLTGVTAGNLNESRAEIYLEGDCGEGTEEVGEFISEDGPDDTGIHTMTIPRSANPAFEAGSILKTPSIVVWHYIPGVAYAGAVDRTDVGTDHPMGSGEEEAQEEDCTKYKKKKERKACKQRNQQAEEEAPGAP